MNKPFRYEPEVNRKKLCKDTSSKPFKKVTGDLSFEPGDWLLVMDPFRYRYVARLVEDFPNSEDELIPYSEGCLEHWAPQKAAAAAREVQAALFQVQRHSRRRCMKRLDDEPIVRTSPFEIIGIEDWYEFGSMDRYLVRYQNTTPPDDLQWVFSGDLAPLPELWAKIDALFEGKDFAWVASKKAKLPQSWAEYLTADELEQEDVAPPAKQARVVRGHVPIMGGQKGFPSVNPLGLEDSADDGEENPRARASTSSSSPPGRRVVIDEDE
uniref:Uncharacterized protein n=1 Tax=Acrobeloides nanus TaxID=290746 RepID=A0A914EFQ7_9BILA